MGTVIDMRRQHETLVRISGIILNLLEDVFLFVLFSQSNTSDDDDWKSFPLPTVELVILRYSWIV